MTNQRPGNKPLVCNLLWCYLTSLPHPNPCFALGSRLDRQWFPQLTNHHRRWIDDLCLLLLCGIGLLYTHPVPNENNIFITLYWTLYGCHFALHTLLLAQATGPSRRNPIKKNYRSVNFNSATCQIWFRVTYPEPDPWTLILTLTLKLTLTLTLTGPKP